jgi:Tfp pilus assembly protein PilF
MKKPQTLLLSEFYTSTAYLNRILFVFFEIENLHNTIEGKLKLQEIFYSLKNFFYQKSEFNDHIFNLSTFRDELKTVNIFIEFSIKNPFYDPQKNNEFINYLNLVYSSAQKLHFYLQNHTNSDVALPQSILGETKEGKTDDVPLISISSNEDDFFTTQTTNENYIVEFLASKRDEKSQKYINKGHRNLANNNFQEAIKSFQMALALNESAEILNLIGWTYSLAGDLNKAKEYALKAIENDSQYGPALNDYGNYLFIEGKTKESLKWFELAKRAINYDNREFAFINAGKAYLQIDMYTEALNEFSLALTFTPHNEELHQAILKIKNSLIPENNLDRLS